MFQIQENPQKDGQKDGKMGTKTLFYRTLQTTIGGPKRGSSNRIRKTSGYSVT